MAANPRRRRVIECAGAWAHAVLAQFSLYDYHSIVNIWAGDGMHESDAPAETSQALEEFRMKSGKSNSIQKENTAAQNETVSQDGFQKHRMIILVAYLPSSAKPFG